MAGASAGKKTTGKKTKSSNAKKVAVATSSLEALQKTKEAGRAEFSRPKRTRKGYDGYLMRGKKFLEELVTQRRKRESERGMMQDGVDTDALGRAFDSTGPNKYSAEALELFLTQKCLSEDKGMSTAEGIRGAFADYWDNMAGDKYAGPYKYDEATDTVRGCPARAIAVKSFMKVVREKDGSKGAAATRHHAEALRIEDLSTIMEWSESQVPLQTLDAESKAWEQLKPERLPHTLKHVMMRAFLCSGFTLWTRNFELCGLQRRDLEFGCVGAAPLSLPFFKVRLENRKGWQNKQGWNGPLENNTYHIYKQAESELDMYTHLPLWITVLEQAIGRPLAFDDYIFPYISPNGLIDPKKSMSHEVVQSLLTEFTLGAGLDKHFTTHCLRRGGAQYRLMFAPLGQRWSLSIVRWWGGWAMGEQVDTLMKYLIDSLQSYENGYNDALCPTRIDTSKTFMGEGELMKPVTMHDIHVLAGTVVSNMAGPSTSTATSSNENPLLKSLMASAGQIFSHCVTSILSKYGLPLQDHLSPNSHVPASIPTPTVNLNGVFLSANTWPVLNGAHSVGENLTNVSSSDSPKPRRIFMKDRLPISGVVIPDLGKKKGNWKLAVTQWEEGDPANGLIPLKDWPREWYSGAMRLKTGSKRRHRELIAKEYQRLGRNDAAFENLYGNAKGQSAIIRAIRQNLGLTRPSASK